ncbi:Fic family protein [Alkanindiges illinoisensis]|uniref:Fic family protein n=1 Tax=Alkanindiges illinoisensis TaxID=197183 RepID=UPI00047B1221|nr:hypothetical protein [Alkanindiges illinoisensis]
MDQHPYSFTTTTLNLFARIHELVGQLTEHVKNDNQNVVNDERPEFHTEALMTTGYGGQALPQWQPHCFDDFLEACRLVSGIAVDSDLFRQGESNLHFSGQSGQQCYPPSAGQIKRFIKGLIENKHNPQEQPLLQSIFFHYDLYRIQPFARIDDIYLIAPIWQKLILGHWRPVFHQLPIEQAIDEQAKDYQFSLARSVKADDPASFVEFMLGVILNTLQETCDCYNHQEQATAHSAKADSRKFGDVSAKQSPVEPNVTPSLRHEAKALVKAMGPAEYSTKELMNLIGLSHRPTFMQNYLQPALEAGWIERTNPDKPNSPKQKYRLRVQPS